MSADTPARPLAHPDTPRQPEAREAHDAADTPALARDPSHEESKLDIALDESFPTSDPPSNTQPGKGLEPAPSSGFSETAEKDRAAPPPLDGE